MLFPKNPYFNIWNYIFEKDVFILMNSIFASKVLKFPGEMILFSARTILLNSVIVSKTTTPN